MILCYSWFFFNSVFRIPSLQRSKSRWRYRWWNRTTGWRRLRSVQNNVRHNIFLLRNCYFTGYYSGYVLIVVALVHIAIKRRHFITLFPYRFDHRRIWWVERSIGKRKERHGIELFHLWLGKTVFWYSSSRFRYSCSTRA